MNGDTPVFLGYRAKEAMPAFPSPSLLHFPPMPPHVRDVCSMCNCLRREAASIERNWEGFNCASCYNTVEGARASVDPAVGESYEVFGYRLLPVLIDAAGHSAPIDFKRLLHCERTDFPPVPANGYESLGFDVVAFTPAIPATAQYAPCMAFFGCSPLSCNGMAEELAVNEHCLFPDMKSALAGAAAFGPANVEPPPYVVVEVLGEIRNKA